jgi:hypothetical protein
MKLISLLLILGGAAGAGLAFWTEGRVTSSSDLAFTALAVSIFAWSVWVGFDLWQGKPRGFTGAKVLFALQIPSFAFHGFSYQFYVGSILALTFRQAAESKLGLEFELGSALKVQFSSEMENLFLGVNLLAIFLLIYLSRSSRQREQIPQRSESTAVS